MYGGSIYVEPKDILNHLSEEDKKKFNQCVFTDVVKEKDGSVAISYVVFYDDTVEESEYRTKLID